MSDHEDPISDEKDALELARFKNKLAQKRYRDRQRVKKSNLFSHIASLERKLARLQTTHEDLEAKNKSLEEVANLVKEEQGSPSLSEQKSGVRLPSFTIFSIPRNQANRVYWLLYYAKATWFGILTVI